MGYAKALLSKEANNCWVIAVMSVVTLLWLWVTPASQPAAYRYASRPVASSVAMAHRPPPTRLSDHALVTTLDAITGADCTVAPAVPAKPYAPVDISSINNTLQYFIDFPLQPPYRNHFGELGRRTRIVRDWLAHAEQPATAARERATVYRSVEEALLVLYPFLRNTPRKPRSTTPLADLRSTFKVGTAGIVIPVSDWTLRYAAHLVASLHEVLHTSLPIQVIYAGDGGLAPENRAWLAKHLERLMDATRDQHALPPPHEALSFLDVTAVFDDNVAALEDEASFEDEAAGARALKAFAALAAPFQKVLVLDPAAVFLQPPEQLLDQAAFRRTGTLFMHDRLVGRGAFSDRRGWLQQQVRRPSEAVGRSRAWQGGYAEEQDGNVVVLDKGRTDVLMGLLHTVWQNAWEVRDELGYEVDYDDKESWWLGMEMTGVAYEFERHYGGIVGWDLGRPGQVCSMGVAHFDDKERLLWYSGSLVKKGAGPDGYEVPRVWMRDASWRLGEGEDMDMSCMVGGEVQGLTDREQWVLAQAMVKAKKIDEYFSEQS